MDDKIAHGFPRTFAVCKDPDGMCFVGASTESSGSI